MGKKIILHIGFEKTGTTSLQKYITTNRSALFTQGVLVPQTGCDLNHWALLPFALDSSQEDIVKYSKGLLTKKQCDEFKTQYVRHLSREIFTSPASNVILSLEHLSSRLKHEREVERIYKLFNNLGESVQVVAYLRPQHEYILSIYSTYVKVGNETRPLRLPSPGEDDFARYDYLHMLSPWIAVFGTDRIQLGIFQKHRLLENDIINDFFNLVGLPSCAAFERPERMNKRLDPVTIEFIRRINPYLGPYATKEGPSSARKALSRVLDVISDSTPLTLSHASKKWLRDIYAENNATLARTLLGREDGILFDQDNEEDDQPDFFKKPPSEVDIMRKTAQFIKAVSNII